MQAVLLARHPPGKDVGDIEGLGILNPYLAISSI
jgi:hypothetical protein